MNAPTSAQSRALFRFWKQWLPLFLADALIRKNSAVTRSVKCCPRFAALRKATLEDLKMAITRRTFFGMMMKYIFLYGPPGAGKSSVGKALAERLRWLFVDLDLEIEKSTGETISQIINEQGESVFRDSETEMLKRVASESSCVIALGGGALLREENRRYAEECGEVVILETKIETLGRTFAKGSKPAAIAIWQFECEIESLA